MYLELEGRELYVRVEAVEEAMVGEKKLSKSVQHKVW